MAQGLKSFTIDAGDVSFILNQVKFATIKVIGYDASGAPLYGYVDASGNEHLLGLAGTFDPTSVIYFNSTDPSDPLIGLPLYNGPRDFQGLRNVSGHFNNLINGQSSWGATGNDFLRLVSPDYTHYVQENIAANNTVSVDGFGVHQDRKSTRLNSSHGGISRMPSSA